MARESGKKENAVKVVLSTIGKFHHFDLARELHKRQALEAIYTGYPMFKLKNEKLPSNLIKTYPWIHAPYMVSWPKRILGARGVQHWEFLDKKTFDRHVSKNIPKCEAFIGLSGSALNTGLAVQKRGGIYICDRGSSHIRMQDRLLREEYERFSVPFIGIDPRVIRLEEAEYAQADFITVPSEFVRRSFVEYGIPENKLVKIPYGVNLGKFNKVGSPAPDRFDVTFVGNVSLQKGVPYLVQAFNKLKHPRKSLKFIGSIEPHCKKIIMAMIPHDAHIDFLGHVPQKQLKDFLSNSHVMVLPSLQEGLAMVQAQALACGCPVIGTTNSGAEDLFEDGKEGYIVPIRDSSALREKMQWLADNPDFREAMSIAALEKVRSIGGWEYYGQSMHDFIFGLINKK